MAQMPLFKGAEQRSWGLFAGPAALNKADTTSLNKDKAVRVHKTIGCHGVATRAENPNTEIQRKNCKELQTRPQSPQKPDSNIQITSTSCCMHSYTWVVVAVVHVLSQFLSLQMSFLTEYLSAGKEWRNEIKNQGEFRESKKHQPNGPAEVQCEFLLARFLG